MAFKEKEIREIINRKDYAGLTRRLVAEVALLPPTTRLLTQLAIDPDRGKQRRAVEALRWVGELFFTLSLAEVVIWFERLDFVAVRGLSIGIRCHTDRDIFDRLRAVLLFAHRDWDARAVFAIVSLLGDLMIDEHDDTPWSQFIDQVGRGEPKAQTCFNTIMGTLGVINSGPFQIYSANKLEAQQLRRTSQIGFPAIFCQKEGGSVQLIVADEQVNSISKVVQQVSAAIHIVALKAMPVFETVRQARQAYERDIGRCWNEIASEVHRGLRRDGADWIRVKIPGYEPLTELRFHAEAPFPTTRIRLQFCYPFGVTIGRTMIVNPDGVREPDTKTLSYQALLLDKLFMSWVAVHALHRQLCTPPGEAFLSDESIGTIRGSQSRPIAPYFRRLPAGAKCSAQAQAWSRATFGREPPAGKTFVSEYTPEQLLADTTPRFVLSTFAV